MDMCADLSNLYNKMISRQISANSEYLLISVSFVKHKSVQYI